MQGLFTSPAPSGVEIVESYGARLGRILFPYLELGVRGLYMLAAVSALLCRD